jgi:hypothetical protein
MAIDGDEFRKKLTRINVDMPKVEKQIKENVIGKAAGVVRDLDAILADKNKTAEVQKYFDMIFGDGNVVIKNPSTRGAQLNTLQSTANNTTIALNNTATATQSLASAMGGIPATVQTNFSSPGAKQTLTEVETLNEQVQNTANKAIKTTQNLAMVASKSKLGTQASSEVKIKKAVSVQVPNMFKSGYEKLQELNSISVASSTSTIDKLSKILENSKNENEVLKNTIKSFAEKEFVSNVSITIDKEKLGEALINWNSYKGISLQSSVKV